eukprot:157701_1
MFKPRDSILQGKIKWGKDEKNPDKRLATLFASNVGFESKMSSIDGSYMIKGFVTKMLKYLEGGTDDNVPFLYVIFDEIQEELGDKVQLPTYAYNNGTRFIKLKINDQNNGGDVKEEDIDIVYEEQYVTDGNIANTTTIVYEESDNTKQIDDTNWNENDKKTRN